MATIPVEPGKKEPANIVYEFQGTITIGSREEAADRARAQLDNLSNDTLTFFGDASHINRWPQSAAGGIVYWDTDAMYWNWHAFDLDMDRCHGSTPGELLVIVRALEMAWEHYETRASQQIQTNIVAIFSDSLGGLGKLRKLDQSYFTDAYAHPEKEIVMLSHKFADKGVKVELHWVPRKARITPHKMADKVARKHAENHSHKLAMEFAASANRKRARSESPVDERPEKRHEAQLDPDPRNSRGRFCVRCNGFGHKANHCPDYNANGICRYCGVIGHGKQDCASFKESFMRVSFEYNPTPDVQKRPKDLKELATRPYNLTFGQCKV